MVMFKRKKNFYDAGRTTVILGGNEVFYLNFAFFAKIHLLSNFAYEFIENYFLFQNLILEKNNMEYSWSNW